MDNKTGDRMKNRMQSVCERESMCQFSYSQDYTVNNSKSKKKHSVVSQTSDPLFCWHFICILQGDGGDS